MGEGATGDRRNLHDLKKVGTDIGVVREVAIVVALALDGATPSILIQCWNESCQ